MLTSEIIAFTPNWTMKIPEVSIYDIHALVDSALDKKEEKLVRAQIEKSADAKKLYADLLHQKELLKSWWEMYGKSN